MTIDIFSSTGAKVKTLELPVSLFGQEVNRGLMHQALVMQQANRRASTAHVKTRGEVAGSTKKLFSQKHTGNARRGPVRSPTLRGGGKVFGPRNTQNPSRSMPQKMRHAALRSCLSLQAKHARIVALENYPESAKTKSAAELLKKMSLEMGRHTLVITDGSHKGASLSMRNLPRVKVLQAAYLNPEDVLKARALVFFVDAISAAEKLFGQKSEGRSQKADKEEKAEKPAKKTTTKKSTSSNKS